MAAQEEPLDDKPTRIRAANQRVAGGAAREGVSTGLPVVCECSDPACTEILLLTFTEWRQARSDPQRFVTFPEHSVEGATLVFKTNRYWLPQRQG
jgi:hypothetical protein